MININMFVFVLPLAGTMVLFEEKGVLTLKCFSCHV